MQKKLIALAIAGLSSAAFAQSNVTVYGVMDVSQTYIKATGGSDFAATSPVGAITAVDAKNVARLDSNSSYVGFKGTEDLGNGLKAVFLIEQGFNADTNNGFTGGRDTYVGVTGGFGTVIAGRLTHPLRSMGLKVELVPGAAGFGTTSSLTGTIVGLKTGADDRANNAVAYVSPDFSGFSGTVAYINGENRTNTVATPGLNEENARQYQIAGQYANGPLWAGLGYHKSEDTRTLASSLFAGAGDKDTAKVVRLAGTYEFPTNTKVGMLYDQTKYTTNYGGVNVTNDEIKRNAWSISVAQRINQHNFGLQYAKSGDLSGSTCGDISTLTAGAIDCSKTSAKMYTLLYTFDLSKRTLLHARYSKLSQDQSALMAFVGANHSFYNSGVSGTAGTGADPTGFSVGIRHNF